MVTAVASMQKLFDSDPRVSFLAHAAQYREAAARGEVLAPAKDVAQMGQMSSTTMSTQACVRHLCWL